MPRVGVALGVALFEGMEETKCPSALQESCFSVPFDTLWESQQLAAWFASYLGQGRKHVR